MRNKQNRLRANVTFLTDRRKGCKCATKWAIIPTKGENMDKEIQAQIIADINAIMEKDEKDKEFLQELLMEMQEPY